MKTLKMDPSRNNLYVLTGTGSVSMFKNMKSKERDWPVEFKKTSRMGPSDFIVDMAPVGLTKLALLWSLGDIQIVDFSGQSPETLHEFNLFEMERNRVSGVMASSLAVCSHGKYMVVCTHQMNQRVKEKTYLYEIDENSKPGLKTIKQYKSKFGEDGNSMLSDLSIEYYQGSMPVFVAKELAGGGGLDAYNIKGFSFAENYGIKGYFDGMSFGLVGKQGRVFSIGSNGVIKAFSFYHFFGNQSFVQTKLSTPIKGQDKYGASPFRKMGKNASSSLFSFENKFEQSKSQLFKESYTPTRTQKENVIRHPHYLNQSPITSSITYNKSPYDYSQRTNPTYSPFKKASTLHTNSQLLRSPTPTKSPITSSTTKLNYLKPSNSKPHVNLMVSTYQQQKPKYPLNDSTKLTLNQAQITNNYQPFQNNHHQKSYQNFPIKNSYRNPISPLPNSSPIAQRHNYREYPTPTKKTLQPRVQEASFQFQETRNFPYNKNQLTKYEQNPVMANLDFSNIFNRENSSGFPLTSQSSKKKRRGEKSKIKITYENAIIKSGLGPSVHNTVVRSEQELPSIEKEVVRYETLISQKSAHDVHMNYKSPDDHLLSTYGENSEDSQSKVIKLDLNVEKCQIEDLPPCEVSTTRGYVFPTPRYDTKAQHYLEEMNKREDACDIKQDPILQLAEQNKKLKKSDLPFYFKPEANFEPWSGANNNQLDQSIRDLKQSNMDGSYFDAFASMTQAEPEVSGADKSMNRHPTFSEQKNPVQMCLMQEPKEDKPMSIKNCSRILEDVDQSCIDYQTEKVEVEEDMLTQVLKDRVKIKTPFEICKAFFKQNFRCKFSAFE
jgi:hypothetical protein